MDATQEKTIYTKSNFEKTELVNVMQEKWDFLIILDACRYDYFARYCKDYFDKENLSIRKSAGSSTLHWRDKTFTDKYDDIVYISSNPFINSVGPIHGFDGRDHFFEVVNVWQTHWDKELGTVLPEDITQSALKTIKRYQSTKRYIIHYLQPHAPYLTLESFQHAFPVPDVEHDRCFLGLKDVKDEHKVRSRVFNFVSRLLKKSHILADNQDWLLRQAFGLSPYSPMDAVRRHVGKENLRTLYAENLKRVLENVKNLIQYLSGTIAITSDHGELLGERGCYAHPANSDHPILRLVPWMVIENHSSIGIPDSVQRHETDEIIDEDEASIKNKLKNLGYLE